MRDMMYAAKYYGPLELHYEPTPVPRIEPDEALLKVLSTGICGTDLRIYHGAHHLYMPGMKRIPGHEVVGDIEAVGDEVKGLTIGQRVFVAPNMGCGHCRQCVSGNNNRCANYEAFGITIDGSFAQYMRIPAAAILQGNLITIPESVDPSAAALIEPFACVLRGQDMLNIQPEDVVLVVGAGPIGMMHTFLAQMHGARKVLVSEVAPLRLAQVKSLGAERVINPSEEDLTQAVLDETGGEGVDVIIIAAPAHKAQENALDLAAIGGRINFFGGLPKDRPTINFNSNHVHYKELTVTGTTACSTNDCRRAAAIVASGKVDLGKLVSARYPLEQVNTAFHEAEQGAALKVVLLPQE
jgi:L-iditol 2-dehydrogenase